MLREGQPQAIRNRRRRQLTPGEVLFCRLAITTILAVNIAAHIPFSRSSQPSESQSLAASPNREKVSSAAKEAYAGTPMGDYLERFPGTSLRFLDCGKSSVTFNDGNGEKIYIGFAVVGNPDTGNNAHEIIEVTSSVNDLVIASETVAAQDAFFVGNYGASETWVNIGTRQKPSFVLTQATSARQTIVNAQTPGLEACVTENSMG